MSLPSSISVVVREIALCPEPDGWHFKDTDSTILLDQNHAAENVGDGPAATIQDGSAQKLKGDTRTHNRHTTSKGRSPVQQNVPRDSQAQARTFDEDNKSRDFFGWHLTAENMGDLPAFMIQDNAQNCEGETKMHNKHTASNQKLKKDNARLSKTWSCRWSTLIFTRYVFGSRWHTTENSIGALKRTIQIWPYQSSRNTTPQPPVSKTSLLERPI